MDDLISRSALLEQMHNHYEVRNPKQNATMDECCMMVIHAPAVDAVAVVRCEDCKHMNRTGSLRWCNWWARNQTMRDEGFCNFGERRDDE